MWQRGAIALLALCTLAACGQADASADADEKPKAEATTTTVAPSTTTTTIPPYSFDGSVPAPPLVNTGTDYEAIYRSLSAYARWGEAHNVDPNIASIVYVPGTSTYDGYVRDLEILNRDELRLVNVDRSLEVALISETNSLVTLRLTERVAEMKLVDVTGSVRSSQSFAEPLTWNAVMAQDEGTWHIASVERTEMPG